MRQVVRVVLPGATLWLKDNTAKLARSVVEYRVLHFQTGGSRTHNNAWHTVKRWRSGGRSRSVPDARLGTPSSYFFFLVFTHAMSMCARRDCGPLDDNVACRVGVRRPPSKIVDLLAPPRVEPRNGRALRVAAAAVGELLKVTTAVDVAGRSWAVGDVA